MRGFNSLQTGKRIASGKGRSAMRAKMTQKFQFPSNGKADRKLKAFGKESGLDMKGFQFPSNGKADRKT